MEHRLHADIRLLHVVGAITRLAADEPLPRRADVHDRLVGVLGLWGYARVMAGLRRA